MPTDLVVTSRRYFYEIMNQANRNTMEEILSSDFVFTLPTHPDPYRGPDGFNQLVSMLHGAFPDFYINPQEMVSEDNTVVTRWRGGGTHKGGALHTTKGDLPASGRFFEIEGITWHIYDDKGQIIRAIGHEDTMGLLMQLGVMPSAPPVEVSPEAGKAMVGRFFCEIMNQGKLDVVDEIIHPEFSIHMPRNPEPFLMFTPFKHSVPLAAKRPKPALQGHAALKDYVSEMRSAFPDLTYDMLLEAAEADRVAIRWQLTGTHQGKFMGIPGSGKKFDLLGIAIFTFLEGKLYSVSFNEHDLGLMQQLELLPA